MAKAVLVMDMPEKCTDCVVSNYGICRFSQEIILEKLDGRPDWCPLRELPEKRDCLAEAIKNDCYDGTGYDYAYLEGKSAGWSACLDEILKECDADGTHALYAENEDFRRYVDRYCTKHNVSVDEALQHYLVQAAGWLYKKQEKKIEK